MMSLALSSDAAIGNVQEKSMKSSNASNAEVVSVLFSALRFGCVSRKKEELLLKYHAFPTSLKHLI